MREIYGLMKEFSESAFGAGSFLADTFPPLANIPVWMQWWRPRARQYYNRQRNIWTKYWRSLQELIAQDKAPECFVKQWVTDAVQVKHGIDDVQAAFVAGSTLS